MTAVDLNMRELLNGASLNLVYTFRYSTVRVHRRENIAEHSWFVVFYCWAIAQDLEAHGVAIDWRKLLVEGTVHDLDEAFTGDFLRQVKYSVPGLKRALDEAAEVQMVRMEHRLGVPIVAPWRSAKKEGVEAHICKLADFMSVASYMLDEITMGNAKMRDRLPELVEHICEVYDHLERWPRLRELGAQVLEILIEACPIPEEIRQKLAVA